MIIKLSREIKYFSCVSKEQYEIESKEKYIVIVSKINLKTN